MIAVTLTLGEMNMGARGGVDRNIDGIFSNRQHAHGAALDCAWQNNIEGALGEVAFAKWSGIYWSGNFRDLRADDVGDFQVRTADNHRKKLILHPPDRDNRIFVLLTGIAPRFYIRGWIEGRDGKLQRYWGDPTGQNRFAFWVPVADLYPMADCPLLAARANGLSGLGLALAGSR